MGFIRMSSIVLFFVLIISFTAYATVIWEENFENNLNNWQGDLNAFTLTESPVLSGTKAVINNDNVNTQLTRPVGANGVITYECWFYDSMGQLMETICAVSTASGISSVNSLLIGIETEKSKDFYTYFLSPDVTSWGTIQISRTKGWHKAEFVRLDTKTELYLDNVKIAETDKNKNWGYVGVWLNGWHSGKGHDAAVFDELRVSIGNHGNTTSSSENRNEDFGSCPDGTKYAEFKPCIDPAINPYVPFEDGFESQLDHWSQRKGRTRNVGGFETTSTYSHTGKFSVKTSSPDHMIAYDAEDVVSDKYFECWFYDDMAKDHASLCGVLYETADYMDSIMAGTETYISSNKYTYHICHATCENLVAEIPRSSGWHQVIIENKAKENKIYIDGIEVFRTEKVPDWRYVFAKVNDWDHEELPVAYFDDLKVDFLRGTLPLQGASENTNIDTPRSDIVKMNQGPKEEAITAPSTNPPNIQITPPPIQPSKETQPANLPTERKSGYGWLIGFIVVSGLVVLWIVLRSKNHEKSLKNKQHLLDATTQENKKKYEHLLRREQELMAKEEEARKKREEAERERQDAVENKKKYSELLKREQELVAKEDKARELREEAERNRIKMEKTQELQRQMVEQENTLRESENARKYREFKTKMHLKKDEQNIPEAAKRFKELFGKTREEFAYLQKYVMEEILATENKEFVEREVNKALAKEEPKKVPEQFLFDMLEIDNMSGKEFEDFLEKMFTNLNYKVKRKKQTRDGGVDLVLENNDGVTVVQAKRFKITTSVPITAVQAVAANRRTYNAKRVMVITTSSKFTVDAQRLADSEGVELVNRARLKELILQAKLIKNG